MSTAGRDPTRISSRKVLAASASTSTRRTVHGSFDLDLCAQAFYFVPRPVEAIAEIARVLRPEGTVVMTLPVAYPGTGRLYSEDQLRELFTAWNDLSIVASGGTAVSRAMLSGYFLHQAEKRLSGPARLLRVGFPFATWA